MVQFSGKTVKNLQKLDIFNIFLSKYMFYFCLFYAIKDIIILKHKTVASLLYFYSL